MQHVVLRRFYEACQSFETQSDKWLSDLELIEKFKSLPEYQALCDVGHPNIREDKNAIENELKILCWMYIDATEKKWLKNTLHKCLPLDELVKQLQIDCGGAIPENIYHDADTLFQIYYQHLEESIIKTLTADTEHIYDNHELDFMIPYVKSPWYDRERIKHQYKQQKPKGK